VVACWANWGGGGQPGGLGRSGPSGPVGPDWGMNKKNGFWNIWLLIRMNSKRKLE
jgi:hypothetical protein